MRWYPSICSQNSKTRFSFSLSFVSTEGNSRAQSLRNNRKASKVPTCRQGISCLRSWCPVSVDPPCNSSTEASLSRTRCSDGDGSSGKYREWNFRACAQVPSRTIKSYPLSVPSVSSSFSGGVLVLEFLLLLILFSFTISPSVLAASSGKSNREVRFGSSMESNNFFMLGWCSGPIPPTTSSHREGKAARMSFAVSIFSPISLWWTTKKIRFGQPPCVLLLSTMVLVFSLVLLLLFPYNTGPQSPQIQCFRCIQQRGQSLFFLRDRNRLSTCFATPKASRCPAGRSSMSVSLGEGCVAVPLFFFWSLSLTKQHARYRCFYLAKKIIFVQRGQQEFWRRRTVAAAISRRRRCRR
mmetsp:Transcript_3156/g.7062  ORF Transcript_3156/g.7062 Transcript_3156/m.7062 type:complete len:353 (-) Transcript_3156:48-1106(-)